MSVAKSKSDPARPSKREALQTAITEKKSLVADLTGQIATARTELARLSQDLATLRKTEIDRGCDSAVAPGTAAGRIRLFLSLFRGRADLFALEWEARDGRSGYSPACENKFKPGICNIREVPCGSCTNQGFLPMDDKAAYSHLAGPEVVGLYPLLPDNSCWLLAADFDGKNWTRDISAFREACRAEGVPVAIERSRSGNGGHAWIFFDQPVAANHARRMGSYLITQAISARHSVDFASYDRLFPNQDSMPKGGFGNLIALPLQHEPRKYGNSVFVDDDFVAFPDQWKFLAGIERMPAPQVEQIAERALRSGQVLGLGTGQPVPSRDQGRFSVTAAKPDLSGVQLPAQIEAVLDSMLRVSKAGLPSSVLSSLKRLAAFHNPEFYKRERMRLSVARTPRVISCFGESGTHLELPRECTEAASELLKSCGTNLQISDQRDSGQKINVKFWGLLSPAQVDSQRALAGREAGILVAPPGTGKTVVGISLIADRGRNTLVLVHRQYLLDQWVNRIAAFLGIDHGGNRSNRRWNPQEDGIH